MKSPEELAALAAELRELQRVQAWALKSEAAPRINALLDLARSELGVPILPDEMDRDPWLFNCPNGTLDLRTGMLRKHRREDLITKLCPTPFDEEAACPHFEKFLAAIFQQDKDLIRFVRRLLGRCLTGDVSEQILPIFWGAGANGKSTLVNVIMETLGGDYAMKANPELLMVARGERHPTELAQLFGKRLVVASETTEGRKLNEALVKDLTGGEPIRARRVKEDFWQFMPMHKVVLLTNHKPQVTGTDHAIWRRLRLVPFEVTFWDPAEPDSQGKNLPPELRQDKRLPERLAVEREGILAWLVVGCREWQEEGLELPPKVKAATEEYRQAEDLLSAWLRECCFQGGNYRDKASRLYGCYKAWCERTGEVVMGNRKWGEEMTRRGFERTTSNGTWYLRIVLRDDSGEEPPENGTLEPSEP